MRERKREKEIRKHLLAKFQNKNVDFLSKEREELLETIRQLERQYMLLDAIIYKVDKGTEKRKTDKKKTDR